MNSRKLASVSLVCTLIGLIGAPLLGQSKGSELPNFKGKHLVTGDSFSLEDLRGKIVLIDCWATWCVLPVHSRIAECQGDLRQVS